MEINKDSFFYLEDLHKKIKKEALKNPKRDTDSYLLDSGKQLAYSHIYYELSHVISKMTKGSIQWKIANLLIGFILGVIFVLAVSLIP